MLLDTFRKARKFELADTSAISILRDPLGSMAIGVYSENRLISD